MKIDAKKFVGELPHRSSVAVIVGRNGAGKSNFLLQIARNLAKQDRKVITISNTPYDRLSQLRHTSKISASAGRSVPRSLIVKAIATASQKGPTRVSGIAEVLRYCGYDPVFTLTMMAGEAFQMHHLRRDDIANREALINALHNMRRERGLTRRLPKSFFRISQEEFEAVKIAFEILNAEDGKVRRIFNVSDSEIGSSKNYDLARLLPHEDVLRRFGVIKTVAVELSKNGSFIDLDKASSGELSLISTLIFLTTTLPDRAVILIDEPENSLHPQWQREYLKKLLDLVYYKEPNIVVATHAPLIVTGVQLEEAIEVSIYEAQQGTVLQISDASSETERRSVEETLWETFKTITPKSHFVSESLTEELEKLAKKKVSLNQFHTLIDAMYENSFDQKQRQFLMSVKKLAGKIARGDLTDDGGADV